VRTSVHREFGSPTYATSGTVSAYNKHTRSSTMKNPVNPKIITELYA
jgi:hypothetical protein